MKDFLEAIYRETFSKELKGLSKIMVLTFGLSKRAWLKIIATDPMDLPHNTYSS